MIDNSEKGNIMPKTRQDKTRQDKTRQDIIFIGNYREQNQGFSGSVYSPCGLSPTIRARDYKEPIQVCIKDMLQAKQDARRASN